MSFYQNSKRKSYGIYTHSLKLKGPTTDNKRQQRKEKSVQIHNKEFAPLSRDYNVDEMLG